MFVSLAQCDRRDSEMHTLAQEIIEHLKTLLTCSQCTLKELSYGIFRVCDLKVLPKFKHCSTLIKDSQTKNLPDLEFCQCDNGFHKKTDIVSHLCITVCSCMNLNPTGVFWNAVQEEYIQSTKETIQIYVGNKTDAHVGSC